MTVTRLPNGRFSPGASGNPTGRPRTESTALRSQLAEHGSAIAAVVVEAAIGGDLYAAKLILDRISPPLKAQAAPILLDLPGPANATSTAAAIIRAAADGDLPPDVAAQLVARTFADAVKLTLERVTLDTIGCTDKKLLDIRLGCTCGRPQISCISIRRHLAPTQQLLAFFLTNFRDRFFARLTFSQVRRQEYDAGSEAAWLRQLDPKIFTGNPPQKLVRPGTARCVGRGAPGVRCIARPSCGSGAGQLFAGKARPALVGGK